MWDNDHTHYVLEFRLNFDRKCYWQEMPERNSVITDCCFGRLHIKLFHVKRFFNVPFFKAYLAEPSIKAEITKSCCAVNCTNHRKDGWKIFVILSGSHAFAENRRSLWIQTFERADWGPGSRQMVFWANSTAPVRWRSLTLHLPLLPFTVTL